MNTNQIWVISGAGGMTGSEMVNQIANMNSNARLILFDNGFNCDLNKVSEQFMKISNPKDLFLGANASIILKPFYDILKGSIDKMLISFDEEGMVDNKIDLIFVNCAAVVHTKWFYQPSSTFDVNVNGMREFLRLAEQYHTLLSKDHFNVKFINCSTSEVYSMQSYKLGGVKEDDYLMLATSEHSLRTSYAFGKLLTEMFAKEAFTQYKLPTCSVRFANVYTENEMLPEHIIPFIIHSLTTVDPVDGKYEVHLLENAKNTMRTFLHNYDSASAVIALATNDDCLNGDCYNVGTYTEYTIADVVYLVAKTLGIPAGQVTIKYDRPARKADPQRRLLNCLRIQIRAGWEPMITLEQGIARCVAAVKENK